MPTRNSYAGDPVAGDVLTAANFKKLPGGWIDYDSTTTNATTSGTTELTIFSTSVGVDANRKLRITFHAYRKLLSVTTDEFNVRIYYDGTQINRRIIQPAGDDRDGVDIVTVVDTTSSGNKTIAVTAIRINGTGTLQFTANANSDMFMLVEDIGPSS